MKGKTKTKHNQYTVLGMTVRQSPVIIFVYFVRGIDVPPCLYPVTGLQQETMTVFS